jgi:acetyltransferase-like isoleucine patch superfamily enzyme
VSGNRPLQSIILAWDRVRAAAGLRLRRLYWRSALGSSGPRCVFGRSLRIYGKQNIHLGDLVHVNDGVTLQSCEGATIRIGSRVVLSYECMILTGGLNRDIGTESSGHVVQPVVIGDAVWLGARCMILPGVTIGARSVVAAGSVVVSDVPENTLVAGVPARVIRTLDSGEASP